MTRMPIAGMVMLVLASTLIASIAQAVPPFTAPFYAYSGVPTPDDLLVVDLNVDGRPDVVTASRQERLVSVLLGRGDGGFDVLSPFAAEVGYWQSMASGLVDGDSIPDLALTNGDYSEVQLFHGNGDGTFSPLPTLASGFQTYSVAIADLNGDEKGDVAVGTYTQLSVFIGAGDGTFSAPVAYPTNTNVYGLAAGDLDGDGDADIVTGGPQGLTRFLNEGGTFVSPVESAASGSILRLVLADADSDPYPDVVATFEYGDDVNVFHGTSTGHLGARTDIDLPEGIMGASLGDLDGDGLPDLVAGFTSDFSSGPQNGAVAVLRGVNGGGYGTPHPLRLRKWTLHARHRRFRRGWPARCRRQ